MKIDVCGSPQPQKNKTNIHVFSMVYFSFCTSKSFEICCRPHTGITCESFEVLQSAKTFDKAPILDIFEILAQAAFVEKDQDDDENQQSPRILYQHITLRIYPIINCYTMNKVLLVVE